MKTYLFLIFTLLAAFCFGHMAMSDPPPIRYKDNPHTPESDIDYSYVDPMATSGSNFPCRGHLDALGTPAAKAVTNWKAGQRQSLTITGGAPHDGGSCQASLSYDNGRTFKVIHSWIGGCPGTNGDSTWDFVVPKDAPSSDEVIFAWSWFNKLGNREMYMNCAVVSISGGGGGGFDSRPDMFVANVDNGCATVDSRDVMLPDPGQEVDVGNPEAVDPTGDCKQGPGPHRPGGGGGGETTNGGGRGGSGEGVVPGEETGDLEEDGEGHSPGNDWPGWFNGAERVGLGRAVLPWAAAIVLFF